MKPIFIYYPKCSTCRRALTFLNEHQIDVEHRDIMLDNPNEEELKTWITASGYPIKRFFNTSGLVYRDMNLKEKLPNLSDDEAIKLLASTGKLIRRPLLISDHGIFVGFNEAMYETLLS